LIHPRITVSLEDEEVVSKPPCVWTSEMASERTTATPP
jgi:hypothetical protein